MSKKRKRQSKGPFVAVPKAILEAPAWRAMSHGARLLWIELRGRLRNDGLNNGRVFLSHRDAAKAIGTKSKTSIGRWYAENEHYGFLRKTSEGFLGADGRGIAAKYRFTDLAHGTHPPTRDFEKWSSEMFVYTPRRGSRKKQNPVPTMGTPRPHHGDIRKAGNGYSVCTHHGDIGEAARCTHHGDISRLPFPVAGVEEGIQGSSTVRAPVQAGGAGSSPAPVASPMCWSTPRLVEVLDPAERAAIQAYWRPKIHARDFRVDADILDIPAFLPPRSAGASQLMAAHRGPTGKSNG
jgi:hypothetical protein